MALLFSMYTQKTKLELDITKFFDYVIYEFVNNQEKSIPSKKKPYQENISTNYHKI